MGRSNSTHYEKSNGKMALKVIKAQIPPPTSTVCEKWRKSPLLTLVPKTSPVLKKKESCESAHIK